MIFLHYIEKFFTSYRSEATFFPKSRSENFLHVPFSALTLPLKEKVDFLLPKFGVKFFTSNC